MRFRRLKFLWTFPFFTLTSNWSLNEEKVFFDCIKLAALSQGAITIDEAFKFPVYLRNKFIDRYEAEKEKANQPNASVKQ